MEKYHKTNKGEIYWSIILTPWIDHLIPELFQIWKMISGINKNCSAEIYECDDKNFIYNNFDDAKYNDNLDFYRWIISKIIMYQGNFELIKKELVIEKNLNRFSKTKNYNYYLLNLFSKFFPSNKIMIENIQIGFLIMFYFH